MCAAGNGTLDMGYAHRVRLRMRIQILAAAKHVPAAGSTAALHVNASLQMPAVAHQQANGGPQAHVAYSRTRPNRQPPSSVQAATLLTQHLLLGLGQRPAGHCCCPARPTAQAAPAESTTARGTGSPVQTLQPASTCMPEPCGQQFAQERSQRAQRLTGTSWGMMGTASPPKGPGRSYASSPRHSRTVSPSGRQAAHPYHAAGSCSSRQATAPCS